MVNRFRHFAAPNRHGKPRRTAVDLAVMCCTLVRRHLPFESSMKPDTSVLPHSNVFESIRTWIEAYKARCSPAELAAAQATFDTLELYRAQAIEADIGLTVDENGERWVRPSKQSRHEATVDGAISAALLLGATIIDGPTVLRLQKEERASRPARAQQVRSSHGVVLWGNHRGPRAAPN